MKIEILYFKNCPHYAPARDVLRSVLLEEGLPDRIIEIEVKNSAEARALGFAGSPTIRVNGLDVERAARGVKVTGLACRRYQGDVPSAKMIRDALREAAEVGSCEWPETR